MFGSFSRPLYRSPGGPSLAPADESLGLFDNHLTNPAARSALTLLRHCAPTDGAEIFERLGGPIVELPEASADEGGQALEGEG